MKKTFTLIELIVVIAIIAILAAIIAPNAFKAIEKAKVSRFAQDVRAIRAAAMAFYADTGQWPADNDGGATQDPTTLGKGFINNDNGSGSLIEGWDGPYVEKWPLNPWGGIYYWDSDNGDENLNGIFPERTVIVFNIQGAIEQKIDDMFDNGNLQNGFIFHQDAANLLGWIVVEGQ